MASSLYPTTTTTLTGLLFANRVCRSRCLDDRGRNTVYRICALREPPPLPPRRRRVARYFLNIPRRVELYFRSHPGRRWTWRFVSLAAGCLCGNTVSLTFGTLAVNDVVAAILTTVFYFAISDLYWSAKRKTYRLQLLNIFKNGVVLALLADAFKLGC